MSRLAFAVRYAVRSLRRDGQRTLLAIFCIAVGVMAIVALRLAGNMMALSVTANVRTANGGDLSVQATALPLGRSDLVAFDALQRRRLITAYLPVGVQIGSIRVDGGRTLRTFSYILDQPQRYPLAGTPSFERPPGATYADALAAPDRIVVSRFIADQLHVTVGAPVRFTLSGGGARTLTVGGVLANRLGAGGPTTVYVTGATYRALDTQPEHYGVVQMTSPSDAAARIAAATLRDEFPTATVQTVGQALQNNQQFSDDINEFLDIVGLLALLIGGIGIVNTIQVLLSRRRVEIAVLKTTGHRRRDLYLLFGLETGLLGVIGGALGTATGIGLSVLVKVLIERVLTIDLSFTIDAGITVEGVLIGLVTALIFGLLPVVRAAEVRPVAVLRDAPESANATSLLLRGALWLVVIGLFAVMAAILLQNAVLAVALVVGAIVVIALLAATFFGVVTLVGRLPVPERATPWNLLPATAALAASLAVATRLRGVGVALVVASLCGFLVVLLPRPWRNVVKLALRSVGRARARTSSTMVALFIGVFTIGVIAVVGQDLSETISNSLTNLADYSVFVIAPPAQAGSTVAASRDIPGVLARRVTTDVAATPVSIDGQPLGAYLAAHGSAPGPRGGEGAQFRLFGLSGVEGYDLARGSLPDTGAVHGRSLAPADAGTANVVLQDSLSQPPLSLHLGDTIGLRNPDQQHTVTVRVVGFYQQADRSASGLRFRLFFQPVIADRGVAAALGSGSVSTIVALKLDQAQHTAALSALYAGPAGDATILDLTDLTAVVQQVLGNVIDLLIAIASLALFAGMVIIANAVALAMLERRREVGILKATGHTSRSVLAQVLIENAAVGGLAAIGGMVAVTLATYPLSAAVLKTDLAVSPPVVLGIIAGIVLLSVVVAALVAWGPARARPIEVLRYE